MKTCIQCKKDFEKPLSLSYSSWKKTQFCSRTCMGLARRNRMQRICLWCKKEFASVPFEIAKGSAKFCSRKCTDDSKKLNGKWSKNYNSCIECKTTKRKYLANGMCHSCYQKKRYFKTVFLKKKYNITKEEYEAMYHSQNGKCKICKGNLPLNIDHDHETGQVRGLLCKSCNQGIGMLKDNIETLFSAIEYLYLSRKIPTSLKHI